jgi:hypothetical protein
MKKCPACQNTYTDDSLSFCLNDGTALIDLSVEAVTQKLPGGLDTKSIETETKAFNNEPIRVNFGQETKLPVNTPIIAPVVSKDRTNLNLVTGLVIGITVSALVGGAIFFGLMMMKRGNDEVAVNRTVASPNISTVANIAVNSTNANQSANETEKLKEKLANLEKQVQQQKNTKPNVPTFPTPPITTKITAKVNSPNDGFLALRSQPNAETGDRIMQIPHGATLTVVSCLAKEAGKKGRWCKVDYEGNSGWAYDGFMSYQK